MAAENQVEKKLNKLARMVMAGVSQVQIAAANGLSEGRISQILKTEEYKKQEELVAAEQYEEMELLNQGWDGIEGLGVQRVLMALQHNPDPDFALRAAVVANKAVRRGGNRQQGINSQSAGVRAVIHLKATFVSRLQESFRIEKGGEGGEGGEGQVFLEQKASDFLPAKQVQSLLAIQQPEDMAEALAETRQGIADDLVDRQTAVDVDMQADMRVDMRADAGMATDMQLDILANMGALD